jgi:hypothetical protein
MKKNNFLSTALLLGAVCAVQAQSPNIMWNKSYGGSSTEEAFSVVQTADGGYVVAGNSSSNNGNVTGNHGGMDYWVTKLDSSGALQWQKTYGGSQDDFAYYIEQTSDGGYIIAGYTTSNDNDVTGFHSGTFGWEGDIWIVKIDANGVLQWQKALGTSGDDYSRSVRETTDGNYIVAGAINGGDGNVTNYLGSWDFWVAKLNGTNGDVLWEKTYGGTDTDWAYSIEQTIDGGYIVAGFTQSDDIDVSQNYGGEDYWVIKLDGTGNKQWEKSYGGSGLDSAYFIQQTTDGGYVMTGFSTSDDGDVTGHHCCTGDYWVVKTDDTGTIQWQKALGGTNLDVSLSIRQTSDGGYIVGGRTTSSDGDISGFHGGSFADYWIVKLSDSGNLQWQKAMGGSGDDWGNSVWQNTDETYIVAGSSTSSDGDISNHIGSYDFRVAKLDVDPLGVSDADLKNKFSVYPNPFVDVLYITGDKPYKLYNMLGQEVYNTAGKGSLANLPKGIYVLKSELGTVKVTKE